MSAPVPVEERRFDVKAPQSVEYYHGQGPVHRSWRSPHTLVAKDENGPTTLWDAISPVLERGGDKPCLGVRGVRPDGSAGDFEWMSYTDVSRSVTQLASALRHLGIGPRERVGVYAKNCPQWVITLMALLRNNQVVVPLYDTLGPDAAAYVVGHAELHTLVVTPENVPKVLAFRAETPSLRRLICTSKQVSESLAAAAANARVELLAWDAVLASGAAHAHAPSAAQPDDLFTIMYTSGTTGVPKGVLLTHANGIATLTAARRATELNDTDVYLSYLPLAHVMEMIIFIVASTSGGKAGFWRGDPLQLLDDMATLKPTILVGVPRVFNRIYDKINLQLAQSSFIKRALFQYAYSVKLAQMHETGELTHALWDRLVFSKIANAIGGRVRFVVSGSAPLSPTVQDFLRIVLSCPVIQGYGLSETTASISLQDLGDYTSGNVGAPQICTEVKLVDVPEMGYTSSGRVQQGEICARGPAIFRGYYKMPEKTAEDVDRDGWFHTGDIGEWLPNGALKIIDRKKNIFKLAQGEYVASEYLETVYKKSRFVAQIFVYGDSFKNFLVAIIVPEVDYLLPWAKKQGYPENMAELCKDERVRKAVLQSLLKVAQDANLKGFERVRAVYLEPVLWTPDTLLTPTAKLKRADAKKKYLEAIERMYAETKVDAKL